MNLMNKKFSICVDMMFSKTEFKNRLKMAKNFNFGAVEFWKWSNKNINEIINCGLPVSIINVESNNVSLSYDLSRGIINDGRVNDFVLAVKESIAVYKKLNAKAMIVLIGENKPYNEENCLKCLLAVKPILESENVNLIIEPLNATDRVGYSMPYATPVFDLIKKVNSKNVKMLYDIYHQHVTGDFCVEEVLNNLQYIGHFHIADAPGRHQVGTGNIDYVNILKTIKNAGYNGYFGLEYRSTIPDEETFDFIKEI